MVVSFMGWFPCSCCQVPVHIGNPSRLERDRLGDQLFPWLRRTEQVPVSAQIEELKQPVHGLGVGLQAAIGVDVGHLNAPFVQGPRDEEGPVAFEGLPLRAQECDAVIFGALNHVPLSLNKLKTGVLVDAPSPSTGPSCPAPQLYRLRAKLKSCSYRIVLVPGLKAFV